MLAVLALAALPVRADLTVSATVDSREARVGESITLSLSIEGAQNVPAPQIRVAGLDSRYVGPATQVSIVNGRITSSVQHRYSLFAMQPGRFEVGPITVTYDGKDYTTSPIGIEFVAANAPAAAAGQAASAGAQGRSLYATMVTPKTDVYLHERIPIDVNLYVGSVRVGDLQFPNLSPEGISIDAFPQPTQSQQVVDGQNFQVVNFHTNAIPMRTGALTIAPAALRLSVYERSRRGADPFFDNFFQQGRQVDLRTEPLTLNVLPLPEAGRPADFSGAVGSFMLRVQAAPTEVTAGDPITVRLEVSGQGNLTDATPPVLSDSSGFRLYDPRTASTDANGRTYEQVLIPNDAGVTTLPPFRFSYFDPQSARYHVLQSQPVALQVRAPQQSPRTDIIAAGAPVARPAPEEQLGRDIVFIKDDPEDLRPRSSPASILWLTLAWIPLPPLLFAATAWYAARQRRLSGDERYARFTRAGKEARRGLATAAQALNGGQRAEFYEAMATTMREYLSAKLGLPIGAVDAEAVGRQGVANECVEQLGRFFASCEQARFAPAAAGDDMRSTLALAEEVVARIERDRRSVRAPQGRGLAIALLILLSTVAPAAAADAEPVSPQTAFFHANSLYRDGRYAEAAAEYEKVVALGLESSPLYFNLGNAYFKVGDRGKAILYFERALRLHPNDPDVEANLAFAQSLNNVEPCSPPWWHRVIFPLAGVAPATVLLGLAGLLYGVVFALLAAQRLLATAPRWLGLVAGSLALATLVLAASGLQQAYIHGVQSHAVVIAEGETAARFEPADNGTVHYSLKQGSLVRVLDQREGWLQVVRCDGRRGWMPRSTMADL